MKLGSTERIIPSTSAKIVKNYKNVGHPLLISAHYQTG